MKKPEETIPVTTPSANGNGSSNPNPEPIPKTKRRPSSIPSILGGKKNNPDSDLPEEGKRHHSEADNTAVTLEEWDGIREILQPGRTRHELDARTDLSDTEIVTYSRARLFAQRYGCVMLDDLVDNLMRMSLSHKRKSRKELVHALAGVREKENQGMGILERLG